jgi:hypothetical protein
LLLIQTARSREEATWTGFLGWMSAWEGCTKAHTAREWLLWVKAFPLFIWNGWKHGPHLEMPRVKCTEGTGQAFEAPGSNSNWEAKHCLCTFLSNARSEQVPFVSKELGKTTNIRLLNYFLSHVSLESI